MLKSVPLVFDFTTIVNSAVVLEILNVQCDDSSLKTAGSNYPNLNYPRD